MRVAVYYCPLPDDPLFAAGATWLGRDPQTNVSVQQPSIPYIDAITADARHYGFHATLKPPMRLADGTEWRELVAATRMLAATLPVFDLPPLAVANIDGFIALREMRLSPELQSLADACIEALDPFRAPLTAAELARRRQSPLSPEQDDMLQRWGYPYGFDTWFFHMTLTRRLSPSEHRVWRPRAEAHFASALAEPRRVTDICLFRQAADIEPFAIAARLALRSG
jgi:putative phosphonate metabolism protein